MTRKITVLSMMLLLLALMAVPAVANNGKGQGTPDRVNKGNSLVSKAEPVEGVEVTARSADSEMANFDEEFTYYRVDFDEVVYSTWVYREPARLGGKNTVAELPDAGAASAFWYGVSAPDADGIQHPVGHDGKVIQYFETEDGWRSLSAEFSEGELVHVNGVAAE